MEKSQKKLQKNTKTANKIAVSPTAMWLHGLFGKF